MIKCSFLILLMFHLASALAGFCPAEVGTSRHAWEETPVRRALDELEQVLPTRGGITAPARSLLQLRWISVEASQSLMATSLPADGPFVSRLQYVMGAIKDPNTAAVLKLYWVRNSFYGLSAWVGGWRQQASYFVLHREEWEAMRDVWSEQFIWLLDQPLERSVRLAILDAAEEWFFEPPMTDKLREYRKRSELDDRERLVVEAALARRGAGDQAMLRDAFERLSRSAPRELPYYAQRFMAVESVDCLARLAAERGEDGKAANEVLQRITFRSCPSEGWVEWLRENGKASRAQWLSEACDRLATAISEGKWDQVRTFMATHCVGHDSLFLQVAGTWVASEQLSADVAGRVELSLAPDAIAAIEPLLEALRRQAEGNARVREVMNRKCLYKGTWADSLSALESNGIR